MVSNIVLAEEEASTRRPEGFLLLWELEDKSIEKDDVAPSENPGSLFHVLSLPIIQPVANSMWLTCIKR